jgi:hypothetical protein
MGTTGQMDSFFDVWTEISFDGAQRAAVSTRSATTDFFQTEIVLLDLR